MQRLRRKKKVTQIQALHERLRRYVDVEDEEDDKDEEDIQETPVVPRLTVSKALWQTLSPTTKTKSKRKLSMQGEKLV